MSSSVAPSADEDSVIHGDLSAGDSTMRWLLVGMLRAAVTDAIRPWSAVRLRRKVRGTARLHLGCGPVILPGWVNADLLGRTSVDVAINIARRLPIDDGSVDAIYHEHVLEHLSYRDGLRVPTRVRQCFGFGWCASSRCAGLRSLRAVLRG